MNINADYLRGFFDGEGCLRSNRPGSVQLVLSNTCHALLWQVFNWLLERDYNASFSEEKPKPLTKIPAYRIDIQEYASVLKWFKEIGSNRSDMWEKWEQIQQVKQTCKRINYPIARKRKPKQLKIGLIPVPYS